MATLRAPPNVTSITFATSGVKVPDGQNLVSGLTAAEVTDCCSPYSKGPGDLGIVFSVANGDVDMFMPASITSITIGGNVKAVAGGKISALPAAAAAAFLLGMKQCVPYFQLVQG